MSQTVRNIILSLVILSSSAVGCTLIAEVDRSKIPDGTGGGEAGGAGGEGASTSSGGNTSTGGNTTDGGAGGEPAGGAGGSN